MIDLRTSLIILFLTLNMLVLTEVYIELDEVKNFVNGKSLILNTDYGKMNHLQTIQDLLNQR